MSEFTEFPIPRKDVSELSAGEQASVLAGLGIPPASQAEAEAGTETDLRSFSPARIAEAIAALGGGGLDTDATILATPDDDLAAKYAEAKALTPNGDPLSATNRAALVLMPGVYTLAAELAVDTNYVDVLGLGAGEFTPAVEFAGNTINVTAWDIRVVGISVGAQNFRVSPRPNITGVTGTASNNQITITNHGLKVGDVVRFASISGGTGLSTGVRYVVAPNNFSANEFRVIVESTGALVSFSTDITAGTLVVENNTSQRFDVCTGGDAAFGGGGGTASGTFTNCTGGDVAFGGFGTLSGKLYYCRLTTGTFETVSGGGITRLCIDGNNAENNQG